MKKTRQRRFIDLCYKLRHCRDATRLWNLIDHMEDRDGLGRCQELYFWVMLAHIRPEFFRDPANLNSIFFCYDEDNPPEYTPY
jgi:hypothetical protein